MKKNANKSILQIDEKMLMFTGAEPMDDKVVHTSLHDMWQIRFGFSKHGLQPNRMQLFH